jgi:hypothetical protein
MSLSHPFSHEVIEHGVNIELGVNISSRQVPRYEKCVFSVYVKRGNFLEIN